MEVTNEEEENETEISKAVQNSDEDLVHKPEISKAGGLQNSDENCAYESGLEPTSPNSRPTEGSIVNKLKIVIAEQEKEIMFLRTELESSLREKNKSCPFCKTGSHIPEGLSIGTQTEECEVILSHRPKSPLNAEENNVSGWMPSENGQELSVADQVREAAENALQQSGFVYEETTGMYYDYKTGYYYDAERGLYYNGSTGTYYYYDPENQSYQFHSQVTVPKDTRTAKKRNKKSKEAKVEKKAKHKKEENSKVGSENEPSDEEGECSSSSQSSHVSDMESISSSESEEEESAKQWPPCMRIIVKETELPNLKVGTLFIVTCQGGVLGKEKEHIVSIPDINVSKYHARFAFVDDKYTVCDLGSRNGTFLNAKRLSVAKQESDGQEVVHGSIVQVGCTKLLCHIHRGMETCGHCEPGLIMEDYQATGRGLPTTNTSKEKDRRRELRRIRHKYGLQSAEVNSAVFQIEGYDDRAKERRKKVGSLHHGEKTEVASLDQAVQSTNKGYKLLSKMGWQEGQGLGKENTGQTEPIPLESRIGREGLGATAPVPVIETARERRKRERWKKAQERFSSAP